MYHIPMTLTAPSSSKLNLGVNELLKQFPDCPVSYFYLQFFTIQQKSISKSQILLHISLNMTTFL